MARFTPFDTPDTRATKAAALIGEPSAQGIFFNGGRNVRVNKILSKRIRTARFEAPVAKSAISSVEELPPGVAEWYPGEPETWKFIGSETAVSAVIRASVTDAADRTAAAASAFRDAVDAGILPKSGYKRPFSFLLAEAYAAASRPIDFIFEAVNAFLREVAPPSATAPTAAVFSDEYAEWAASRDAARANVVAAAKTLSVRESSLMRVTADARPTPFSVTAVAVTMKARSTSGRHELVAACEASPDVPFVALVESDTVRAARTDLSLTPESFVSDERHPRASECGERHPIVKLHRGSFPAVAEKLPDFSAMDPEKSVYIYVRASDGALISAILNFSDDGTAEDVVIFTETAAGEADARGAVATRIEKAFRGELKISPGADARGEIRGVFDLTGSRAEAFSLDCFYFSALTHPAIRPYVYVKESVSAFSDKVNSVTFYIGAASAETSGDDDAVQAPDLRTAVGSFRFETEQFFPKTRISPAVLPVTMSARSRADLPRAIVAVVQAFHYYSENVAPGLIPELSSVIGSEIVPVAREAGTRVVASSASASAAAAAAGVDPQNVKNLVKTNETQTRKITDLYRNAPEGTVSPKCMCKFQPVFIAPDEVEAWSSHPQVVYKNATFVCPNPELPNPIIVPAQAGSPAYPCCQKTARVRKSPTASSSDPGARIAAASSTRSDYVITKATPVPDGRFGSVSPGIARMIRAGEGANLDLVRVGVGGGLLSAVGYALGALTRKGMSPIAKAAWVADALERIRAIPASAYAQEFPDRDLTTAGGKMRAQRLSAAVDASLADGVDSEIHIRGLIAALGVNVYVFAATDTGHYAPEIPRHAAVYLRPPAVEGAGAVVIARFPGGVYEPIVSRGTLAVPQIPGAVSNKLAIVSHGRMVGGLFGHETVRVLERAFVAAHQPTRISGSTAARMYAAAGFSVNAYLSPGGLFSQEAEDVRVLAQYIDFNGKLRGVRVAVAGVDGALYVETPILPPMHGPSPPPVSASARLLGPFPEAEIPAHLFSDAARAGDAFVPIGPGAAESFPGADTDRTFQFVVHREPRVRAVTRTTERVPIEEFKLGAVLAVQFCLVGAVHGTAGRGMSFRKWAESGAITERYVDPDPNEIFTLCPPARSTRRMRFPESATGLDAAWPGFVSHGGTRFTFPTRDIAARVVSLLERIEEMRRPGAPPPSEMRGVFTRAPDFFHPRDSLDTRIFTSAESFYAWVYTPSQCVPRIISHDSVAEPLRSGELDPRKYRFVEVDSGDVAAVVLDPRAAKSGPTLVVGADRRACVSGAGESTVSVAGIFTCGATS